MIRPDVGQVAEWVEVKSHIKPLLALRWAVERGRVTDWPEPQTEFIPVPKWSDGGIREGAEC